MQGEEKRPRAQNLILESRKRLTVSGVSEVIEFDDTLIRMKTDLGDLIVHGDGLHVESLSVETGDLVMTGEVSAMNYENVRERSGLFGWLGR